MEYPFWDAGAGYGLLMASVAVLHVFVSHFAIGGGLYLVVAETSARRVGDTRRLQYLERLTRFFVLVTLVFGALSGVGIWFIIGLLNPAATEVLIHNFVWGWAIEWTFFVVEITSAIVYLYGWKTMSGRDHRIVGWIYFAAAWLSLFVINGIVCFMLTPGRWLETGSFWDGFFNPTFWPSLFFRSGMCLLLAGVYTLLVASRERDASFRAGLVRYNATWAIAGIAVIAPSWWWYWKAIPESVTAAALERMATPISAMHGAYLNVVLLAVVLLGLGLWLPRRMSTAVAAIGMLLALSFFGEFEWMRESIRKPYVIYGYMYGNGVEVAQANDLREDGYLAHIAFRTGDNGADLFRHACRSCHTLGGYKALRPSFDGTDPHFIAAIVMGAGSLRGQMPPFYGTEEEASLVARYVWERVDQRPLREIYGVEGIELGRKVFEVRCGCCHEFGGFRDNRDSLVALGPEEYDEILDNGADYGEAMPNFSGSEEDREALFGYLQSLGRGGGS